MPPIFAISAWQQAGVKDLLQATYQLVQESEFIPLEEAEESHQVYQLEEEAGFQVEQVEEGLWELSGPKIEKLFAMTNTAHDESLQRFARQVRAMGVDQALREAGAKDGDTILLMDFQFEFVD